LSILQTKKGSDNLIEQKIVTEQTIGFSYHVTLEKELRTNTGAKYPDKTVIKASLGGHVDTIAEAITQLKVCSTAIKTQIAELEAE